MNTKNAKEIEKFRENYIEVEARDRDFTNQNEQLAKDNQHFVMKLDETQVTFKLLTMCLTIH